MTDLYTKRTTCRASGSTNLVPILSLGEQCLTGVFPASADEAVPSGPLDLVYCPDSGLVQLGHTYNPEAMYGSGYGYRSGLNGSMVRHLTAKAHMLEKHLRWGDVVLDIGSNDGTFLKAFRAPKITRIGMDPAIRNWASHYVGHNIITSEGFFDRDRFFTVNAGKRAKLITTIACFYDVDDPVQFAKDVADCLMPDGVWHIEMAYLPAMLRTGAYDQICHEHATYWTLTALAKVVAQADMLVTDVSMNDVNGGSFAVTVRKRPAVMTAAAEWVFLVEEDYTAFSFEYFAERVEDHRTDMLTMLEILRASGKTVFGYGASTKGNVLLQYCGIGPDLIEAIAEVNEDKFGKFTPGTHIPIISETEAKSLNPDYYLVLPWHFREGIVAREAEFLAGGGRLIFPFPAISIV